MNFDEIASEFEINNSYIWLNNCGVSVPHNSVTKAVTHYLSVFARNGILQKEYPPPILYNSITRKLADMFAVGTDEVTVIHNTNEGFSFLSYGLNLQPGDEILLPQNEYPSNVYPWQHWKDKGVQIRYVPETDSPETFIEIFKASLSDQVKVVSYSAVSWLSGMPFPLQEMGALCRERNILFAVDAAQGAGLVALKPREMNISFMAFSAWKWLMGPLGLGGMYISRELLSRLQPVFMGTGSVVNDEVYLPYRKELKANAERYVTSTASMIDWVWFDASLAMLQQIGFDRVRERITSLADCLTQELRARGFFLRNNDFPEHKTGIISAWREGLDADRTVRRLREFSIVAASRQGRIRFSPHLCNTEAQMKLAAEHLAQIAS